MGGGAAKLNRDCRESSGPHPESSCMLASFRGTWIPNKIQPDNSIVFAADSKFPESDHALIGAEMSPLIYNVLHRRSLRP